MPKNDVYLRSLTGIVFLAAVIFPVVNGFIPFFILCIIVSSICMAEFLRIHRQDSYLNYAIVFAVNFLLLLWASALSDWAQKLSIPIVILSILVFIIIGLFKNGIKVLDGIKFPFFAIIYITFPFLCFIQYSRSDLSLDYNWQKPLFVFILVWSSDTFAYVAGRLFGKHLLFPSLSPKKTIEGLIGGTLLAGAAGATMAHFWPHIGMMNGIVLGVLVSIFGTAGDLFESALKRNADVKDSGNLIPGHGGFLDRFDAFLFAAVIVYVWYLILPMINFTNN